MEQSQILTVIQDAVTTILYAILPMVGAALIIGLVISIFQAATQIHEQTMTFVPKIVGVFLVLLVFGGFILSVLTQFWERIFDYIEQFIV